MESEIIIKLLGAVVAIGVVLFFLRGVNLWYWRINDLLFEQLKTNHLLERIALALNATESTMVTLVDTESNETKIIPVNAYIRWLIDEPGSTKYKIASELDYKNKQSN